VKHATLLGRDHTELGELAAISEGPAAITICRGGAAKTYSYTDPNEDAALFALGEGGVLLAVADGHDGHQGSMAAVETLRDAFAEDWCGVRGPVEALEWSHAAAAAVVAANHAILAEAAERSAPTAPTTLAFALWRRDDGVVHGASVGDSHVFFSSGQQTRDVAERLSRHERRSAFLGRTDVTEGDALEMTALETCTAHELLAVVLATDGLSEHGIGVEDPPNEVQRAREHAWAADAEVRPMAVAKAVTALALGAQRRQRAGDNIACAVALLG